MDRRRRRSDDRRRPARPRGGGATTLRVYSHFIREPDRVASDVMAGLLGQETHATREDLVVALRSREGSLSAPSSLEGLPGTRASKVSQTRKGPEQDFSRWA